MSIATRHSGWFQGVTRGTWFLEGSECYRRSFRDVLEGVSRVLVSLQERQEILKGVSRHTMAFKDFPGRFRGLSREFQRGYQEIQGVSGSFNGFRYAPEIS